MDQTSMEIEKLIDDVIECARAFERLPTRDTWTSLHAAKERLRVHIANDSDPHTSGVRRITPNARVFL